MIYISPRRVLRAAAPVVRLQFWGTVGVCLATATVSLSARNGEPRPQPEWLDYWPVITTAFFFIFNTGILWQQLSETKRRLERLEANAPTRDAVADRFEQLDKDIEAFGARFERYLETVQTWTSKVETAVHDTQQSIARLDERMKGVERK